MVIPRPLTRNLFFTGKGGVGKTSVASATAVGLADEGRRVLLVSTDPASNLDEVFGVELASVPMPVPGVPGLLAMNIDPEAAARTTGNAWSAPIGACSPMPPSRAWRSNSRAPALSKSRPSMSSHDSSAILRPRRSSTTSSSTRPPPGTRFVSSSFPQPGRCSLRTMWAATPAWGRSRVSRRKGKLYIGTQSPLRPGNNGARPREPRRSDGASRGGADERGSGRTRDQEPTPGTERAFRGKRSQRPQRGCLGSQGQRRTLSKSGNLGGLAP